MPSALTNGGANIFGEMFSEEPGRNALETRLDKRAWVYMYDRKSWLSGLFPAFWGHFLQKTPSFPNLRAAISLPIGANGMSSGKGPESMVGALFDGSDLPQVFLRITPRPKTRIRDLRFPGPPGNIHLRRDQSPRYSARFRHHQRSFHRSHPFPNRSCTT